MTIAIKTLRTVIAFHGVFIKILNKCLNGLYSTRTTYRAKLAAKVEKLVSGNQRTL